MKTVSWLYAFSLCFTVLILFVTTPFHWVYPVAALLLLLAFLVCGFTEKHHLAGTPVILGMLLIASFFGEILSSLGRGQTGLMFWQWLVSAGTESDESVFFLGELILFVSMIFGISVYYFAIVRFRVLMLVFLLLMPYVLYVKTIMKPELPWIILPAALFVLLVICRAWDGQLPASLLWSALFTFLIPVIIGAAVPKSVSTPYYYVFQSLFLYGDTTSVISEDFSGLADRSGNADFYREGTERRLYSISGDVPSYLRRQIFDLYDYEQDCWVAAPGASDAVDAAARFEQLDRTSLREMGELLRLYKSERPEEGAGLSEAIRRGVESETGVAAVTAVNFAPRYYLSAARPLNISVSDTEGFVMSVRDTFRTEVPQEDRDLTYYLSFQPDTDARGFIEAGGSSMSYGEEDALFRDLREIILARQQSGREAERTGEFLETLECFRLQKLLATQYAEEMQRLSAPATEIITREARAAVGDADQEVLKAIRLLQYFSEGGFLYDLDYRAPDDSPDYLLTKGKTGTCSDFATAYVLMARSVGLIARYAEGYVPERSPYADTYLITTSDSHAYAEVYLPLVGWTALDPTAYVEEVDRNNVSLLRKIRYFLPDLRSAFSMVVLCILAYFFYGILRYLRVDLKAAWEGRHLRGTERLIYMYRNLRRAATDAEAEGAAGMTPQELTDLAREYDVDLAPVTDALSDAVFGQKESSSVGRTQWRSYHSGMWFFRVRFRGAYRRRCKAAERRSREYNNAARKAPEGSKAPAPEERD
ncbi:MAG: transglutaminase-like domain-containing protein [Lachnospiraceae bacterium]|nr:transglutaminase-like domain-containing protein [Lachnospiraceae bacterium]